MCVCLCGQDGSVGPWGCWSWRREQTRVLRADVVQSQLTGGAFVHRLHVGSALQQTIGSVRYFRHKFRPRDHHSPVNLKTRRSTIKTILPPHPLGPLCWLLVKRATIMATRGYGILSTWHIDGHLYVRLWRLAATRPRGVGHEASQFTPRTDVLAFETRSQATAWDLPYALLGQGEWKCVCVQWATDDSLSLATPYTHTQPAECHSSASQVV